MAVPTEVLIGIATVIASLLSSFITATVTARQNAASVTVQLLELQQSRISQLHTDLSHAEERLDAVEKELNQTRQELAAACAENEMLKHRVVELEAERELWENERQSLQKQIAEIDKAMQK